jgi:hypothetical protein
MVFITKTFRNIFRGLDERFGYHIADYEEGDGKKSGDSFTSNYAHTLEMWQAHLEGKKFQVKTNRGSIEADSLGLCPINKNSKCRWGAMDLDNYKPSIPELFKKLKSLNVPTIPFRSKSGGIHLCIFLTEEVPALLMREKLHSIKNIFGVEKPDKIFPVQKYLNLEKGSAGSWINLPYYNAAKTERYMIKENGDPATLEEFFEAYQKNKVTPAQLKKLKSNIDEGESGDWFKEGPPCMQALAKFGVEKKVRNETLLDMTRYIKLRYPEKWRDKAGEYNKKIFKPPMDYTEVNNVIGSREKKDYPYRCESDWLKPHCDRAKCILRKFGVGNAKGENNMILGPLSYVKSIPKIWYLGFNGEEVKLNSKELVKPELAREAATEQTGKTPPRTKNWDDQIRLLQEKATPMDAPEESLPMYKLKQHIRIFCFNMRRTEDRAQLLFGKPFVDTKENKIHFQFDSFYTFLETKKWKDNEATTHEMLQKIEGVKHDKLHISKNVKRNVYTIDIKEFEEQKVDLEIPDFGVGDKEVPF